ncbi:hypothetical protein NPIL_169621 [Nephila pilipes]|uniref:Uncharacterized protein n=1 Tax=Nephila pilipes TaxID=299642 RepID=A0A8X6JQ44_NEPPI|nr:hypothetical protein NPIL_169621 [Nephila pilipes]
MPQTILSEAQDQPPPPFAPHPSLGTFRLPCIHARWPHSSNSSAGLFFSLPFMVKRARDLSERRWENGKKKKNSKMWGSKWKEVVGGVGEARNHYP